MHSLRFGRFTQPIVLLCSHRELVHRFFLSFEEDLRRVGVALPSPALSDEEYFRAVAKMVLSPEHLPPSVDEALYAVQEMTSDEGRERLRAAFAADRPGMRVPDESSNLDLAILAWLDCPQLFTRKHAEVVLRRLCTFTYHLARRPVDRRATFRGLPPDAISGLRANIDAWCASHQKGVDTVTVGEFPIDGEYLYPIRHGENYARLATAEKARPVIHFRPGRDDLVVYSPALDEIRIHAKQPPMARLYRECFGYYLFEDPLYFACSALYTLAPLIEKGAEALSTDGFPGIVRITLREVKALLDGQVGETVTRNADDLFAGANADARRREVFPANCRPLQATLDFRFDAASAPRPVQIRLPNKLRVARRCDTRLVHEWLSHGEFRVPAP